MADRKNAAMLLLAGMAAGIIIGVEAVQTIDERICPRNPCLAGNEVTVLVDRAYFPQAHIELQKARKTVHMAVFELKYYENFRNSSANILVDDLIEAKKRGVEVKVLVDEFSDENNALPLLRKHGVEIKNDNKNVTTHAKLIIIDGETVILGSTNLSYYGLEKNSEANVKLVSREAAEAYEKYFEMLWRSC